MSAWAAPRTFVAHARDEWIWLLVPVISVPATVIHESVDDPLRAAVLGYVVPVLLLMALYRWVRRRFGGWVTVDPSHRELRWRRLPLRSGRTVTWDFGEITAVNSRRSRFSGAVDVRFGEHSVRLRVPREHAEALATSLRDASDR